MALLPQRSPVFSKADTHRATIDVVVQRDNDTSCTLVISKSRQDQYIIPGVSRADFYHALNILQDLAQDEKTEFCLSGDNGTLVFGHHCHDPEHPDYDAVFLRYLNPEGKIVFDFAFWTEDFRHP